MSKKAYLSKSACRKLTLSVQMLLFQLVIQKPGITPREIQAELLNVLGIDVSESTICQFLAKNGFTYQRLKVVAKQRDEMCRQLFIRDMSVYSSDMLVFVDETGADKSNSIRKYGYSLRGKPLVSYKLLARGQHVTAIACIFTAGVLDVMTVKSPTSGDTFYQTHLLPYLLPFNGTLCRHHGQLFDTSC